MPSYQQSGPSGVRLKEELPAHQIASASRRNRQNEIALRFGSGNYEGIGGTWKRWHDIPRRDMLELRNDLRCARMTAIVDPIVAVPAGASGAHLHQPWPHELWRRGDCDGMHDRARRIRDESIAR